MKGFSISGGVAKPLSSHPATVAALALAVVVFLVVRLWRLDLFEAVIGLLQSVEHLELDEFIIPLLILLLGLLLDAVISRYQRQVEIQAQRLRILQATMHTVQDIVNNFLGGVQLFVLETEQGTVNRDSLAELDASIQSVAAKLRALANLETIPEKQVGGVSVIDYNRKPPPPA